MNNTLKTVELLPNASMIELARQVRLAGTSVLRAIWRKASRTSAGHWAIQYSGADPNLAGLAA